MNLLKKILELDAEMSRIGVERDKLRRQYVDENCPYKQGQKILMKPEYGQEEFGVIRSVYFSDHSPFIKGMAHLNVKPMSKNWKEKERRSNVTLRKDSEIIKVFPVS